MAYWLLKSEPEAYSFADLMRDRQTAWTGIRNAQARNNLAQMQPGDDALIYHSVTQKAVVGRARIVASASPDVTAPADSPWLSVDVEAVAPLTQPVPLATIKADPRLAEIGLVRQSRLSVVPLTVNEYRALLELGS
jgi:predicted RNA-binding protein with PUA-like domain